MALIDVIQAKIPTIRFLLFDNNRFNVAVIAVYGKMFFYSFCKINSAAVFICN